MAGVWIYLVTILWLAETLLSSPIVSDESTRNTVSQNSIALLVCDKVEQVYFPVNKKGFNITRESILLNAFGNLSIDHVLESCGAKRKPNIVTSGDMYSPENDDENNYEILYEPGYSNDTRVAGQNVTLKQRLDCVGLIKRIQSFRILASCVHFWANGTFEFIPENLDELVNVRVLESINEKFIGTGVNRKDVIPCYKDCVWGFEVMSHANKENGTRKNYCGSFKGDSDCNAMVFTSDRITGMSIIPDAVGERLEGLFTNITVSNSRTSNGPTPGSTNTYTTNTYTYTTNIYTTNIYTTNTVSTATDSPRFDTITSNPIASTASHTAVSTLSPAGVSINALKSGTRNAYKIKTLPIGMVAALFLSLFF